MEFWDSRSRTNDMRHDDTTELLLQQLLSITRFCDSFTIGDELGTSLSIIIACWETKTFKDPEEEKPVCAQAMQVHSNLSLSLTLLSSMFFRTSFSLVVFLYSKLFGTKKLFFAQNMEKLLVGGSGFAWIAALVQLNSLQSVWIPF